MPKFSNEKEKFYVRSFLQFCQLILGLFNNKYVKGSLNIIDKTLGTVVKTWVVKKLKLDHILMYDTKKKHPF